MIAIVPARGGSKGLPGKNIKCLLGKPLIAYTIEAALESKYITDVIISTDDKDIYEVALKYGATPTFLRPTELAKDDSLAIDNYIYTINRLRSDMNITIDSFVVLQPTSPLRVLGDIDEAIQIFNQKNADSVVSYTEESHPISWHKHLNENGKFEDIFNSKLDNRQGYRPTFYPNGAIFVFKSKLIESKEYYNDNSYAYIMPRCRSVDIDTQEDFNYAEFLLRGKDAK